MAARQERRSSEAARWAARAVLAVLSLSSRTLSGRVQALDPTRAAQPRAPSTRLRERPLAEKAPPLDLCDGAD
jgi:hypothetical protein